MNRLSMAQCPACARANADKARYCTACGTPLVMRCPACDTINVRTRQRCHHCAALLDPTVAPQSVAADEPPVPTAVVPLLDLPDDPPPEGWVLSLREHPLPSAADPGASPGLPLPTLDPLQTWPADAAAPVSPPATTAPSAAGSPTQPDEALAERKARQRAAVRRAQMRRAPPPGMEPQVLDVLVLEADPKSRTELCRTLELFGFRAHVAVSAAEATGLSLRQRHVAAFLGIGSDYDAADTEALCRQLHDAPKARPLALIAISDRRHHADRIRMQLAGADRVLFRPVGRGDVARALDDCGLRLPRDPRAMSAG